MSIKQHIFVDWRICLLVLLAGAMSFGFNGNGCNFTANDTISGSSNVLVIKANSTNTIRGHDSGPNSEINVPAQAVDNDTEVIFTAFRQKEDLPVSLPDGYEFLGGANLKPRQQNKVDFNNGREADAYVVLPEGIRAEELSNADIRLMEFIDSRWVIVLPDKKGKVYTSGPKAGYIGPDEVKPAKLTGIRPFCWVRVKPPVIILPPIIYTPPPENTTPISDTITPPPITILPPPDTTPPSIPTGLVATYTGASQILLFWNASTDNVAVAGYKVYRNNALRSTLNATSYTDTGLSASVTYEYKVTAYDSAGNISSYSNVFNITIPPPPDTQAPATTQTAVDDYVWVANYSSNNITRIRKSDSTTTTIAVGTNPYGIAVDATYCWVANGASNNVTCINKSDLTQTTIAVGSSPRGVAVDETYCWVTNSGSNNITRIRKSDLTQTTIAVGTNPYGIAVDATYCWVTNWYSNNVTRIRKSDSATTTISVGTGPIGVAVDETYCWVANRDSNNVTRIRKSDLTQTTIAVGSYLCWGVAVDETYVWVASFGYNNISRIRKLDLTTATITVGTRPVGIAVDGTYCWVANNNSNNVTRIQKSNPAISTTIAAGSGPYSLGDMTGYVYDFFFQNPVSATPDTILPSVPTGLIATAVSSSQMNLSWNSSTDNVGVVGYKVYRNGALISTLSAGGGSASGMTSLLSYSDTGLSSSTTYSYSVAAYDAAGNNSPQSSSVSATTLPLPDTTAPSIPTGLIVTVPSSNQINLTWNASIDNIAMGGYKIYRNGTYLISVGVTSYSDTGLFPSTTYSYTVASYDAVGNNSPQSSSVSATTLPLPDTTAPSIPTGLTVISVTASSVIIIWQPSTDNIGVAGYKTYRNGVYIGTNSTTSYNNTGLLPSTTYNYTIAAYDAAGNTSAQSVSVSATTLASTTTQSAVDDYVWVANAGSNKVTRIQKSDLTTTNITVGSSPWGVAVDETYCWVVNQSSNNVTRINKLDLTTTTIAVRTQPLGVAVDATYIWVVYPASNNVTRIQKSNTAVSTTITVGAWPFGVAVDETYCWVANQNSYNVTRIQKSDLTTTTIGVGSTPVGVAVDETYCWVANGNSANVTRIRKSDLSATTIPVGVCPAGVAVDETYCWVANQASGNVTRIRKSDLSTATITAGTNPYGTAVDEIYCWVSNQASGNVTRIRKSDLSIATIGVGTLPYSLGDMTGYGYDFFFRNPVSATPDTIPPSVPTGLSVIAVSSNQINLSWNVSTDNVAVAGYKVYRNGTLISTLSSLLSYSDTGLTPTTGYSYTVAAYDAAGNTSNQSTTVSVTTPLTGYDHGGADWTPANGTEISGVHTNIGTFSIPAGTTVYSKAYNGSNDGSIEIQATNIIINGTLNADGRGYRGGRSNGNLNINGEGSGGGQDDAAGASGAGYAGRGGEGACAYLRTNSYGGIDLQDAPMGSGGGGNGAAGSGAGGNGGGAVILKANTISCAGIITAKGIEGKYTNLAYPYYAPGGGSGGTVMIISNNIVYSGKIYVNGANGTAGYYTGGGGSGGRIKLFTTINITANGFLSANGGNGGNGYDNMFYTGGGADAGTIYISGGSVDVSNLTSTATGGNGGNGGYTGGGGNGGTIKITGASIKTTGLNCTVSGGQVGSGYYRGIYGGVPGSPGTVSH